MSGRRSQGPAAGDVPNEDEAAAAFPHVDSDRPLKDQVDLEDETGEDIRRYTGEPVETEHGVVVPQQMVVGSERVVGSGEFPNTAEDDEAEGD